MKRSRTIRSGGFPQILAGTDIIPLPDSRDVVVYFNVPGQDVGIHRRFLKNLGRTLPGTMTSRTRTRTIKERRAAR